MNLENYYIENVKFILVIFNVVFIVDWNVMKLDLWKS